MKHRGVVVEIAPKNKVIVMTPDGEFLKVPYRKHMHVGQEIRYTPRKPYVNVLQAGLVATLFLAVLGGLPMLSNRQAPSATAAYIMTVDVNPSLELQISAEYTVLALDGLNQQGKELASQLDVLGNDIRQALQEITSYLQANGYLGLGEKQVLVTIATPGSIVSDGWERQVRELQGGGTYSELQRMVEEVFGAVRLADVRILQVPYSVINEARLAGITPSRYLAIHLPAQFAIPPRTEVRLTMVDVPDYASIPYGSARQDHVAQAQLPRGVLTPVQWTKQSMVSFPIVAEIKDDFRLGR